MHSPKPRPYSPMPSPSERADSDDGQSLSRYKVNDMIKSNHAEKRARRQGRTESMPSYMAPTVASLFKRESFRYSNEYLLGQKRSQSLDHVRKPGFKSVQERQRPSSELDRIDSCDMATSPHSLDLKERETESPDVQQMCRDVEVAYRGIFPKGTSPKPSSDHRPGEVKDERGDDLRTFGEEEERPKGSPDVRIFLPTQSFGTSGPDSAEATPSVPVMEGTRVAAKGEAPKEQGPEIRPHPFDLNHSASFDSTAAITNSPRGRPASPIREGPGNHSFQEAKMDDTARTYGSHLDHAVPQNESIDGSIDSENSDGSRSSTEVRCKPGAAISGSPPTGGYVHISEDEPRSRRPYNGREKTNVKRSFLLAGLFTGVAVLVGTIFGARK